MVRLLLYQMNNLFRIALIYFLIELISSFVLQQRQSKSLQLSNLGFYNYSCSSANASQISSFINFINSGSIYYRDNTELRLAYIGSQMNYSYGVKAYGFSILQGDNENDYEWSIYSSNFVCASVAAGVDRIFPSKSFMYLRDYIGNDGRVYFNKVGQKGYGVSSVLQNVLKSIILSVETTQTCICSGLSQQIRDLIYKYDGTRWNVFCSAAGTLSVSVFPRYGRYAYLQPQSCYYVLYMAM